MTAIKARLIKDIKTEAEWLLNDPIIYKGETINVLTDLGIRTKTALSDGLKFSLIDYDLDIDGFKSGVKNADLTDSPIDGVDTYNVSSAGTYTSFGGLEVVSDDLDAGQVQLRRKIDGSWEKVIIAVDLVNYAKVSDLNAGFILQQELSLKNAIGEWIPKDGETTLTYANDELLIENSGGGYYKGAFGGGDRTTDVEGDEYIAFFEAKVITGGKNWYLTMSQIGDDSSKLIGLNSSYKKFFIKTSVLSSNKRFFIYSPDLLAQSIKIKNFIYAKKGSSEFDRIELLGNLNNNTQFNYDIVSGVIVNDLPDEGYLNASGKLILGVYGHLTSKFYKVDAGSFISIKDVTVGGLAITCAFYSDKYDEAFVEVKNDGDTIADGGYVRFCGQTFNSDSFSINKTISEWNEKVLSADVLEKKLDAIPSYGINRELSDILSPDWSGKIEFRSSNIEPSINTKGLAFLFNNAGTIELRVVKDAESIISIPVTATINPLLISPVTRSIAAVGDSITYGIGAATKYLDQLITLLNNDGHTATATNYGISGQDASQLFTYYSNNPITVHDIASLMIGINDIEHWVINNGIAFNNDLKASDFRSWYRFYLNKLIDLIIDQTGCNSFFLITPTPQIVEFDGTNYLPTVDRYVANPLMQVVIQECIRATKLRSNLYLCRGDYYLKNATLTEIGDRIHPTDAGAALLAKGIRDEMTYRL